MQKSIVIVSEYYNKQLFFYLLNEFKSIFLKSDENNLPELKIFPKEKLEKIYNYFLKIIESETEIEIEDEKELKIENKLLNYKTSFLPQDNNFFQVLSMHYVSKIWNLWELIITESPLLVQSDSPRLSSGIVFLLSSLIFPLNFSGDVRPYFTIYDNDFKDYRDDEKLKNSNTPILGVINPICVKTFNDWPILHFDDLHFQEMNLENPTKQKNEHEIHSLCALLELPNLKRKFLLPPNKALIKTFSDYLTEGKGNVDKLNLYLRMYLIELNNDFMRTFEEYFFGYEKENIKRISTLKNNFSIFEIFNKLQFFKYLNTVNPYFNLKYINNKKKTSELYLQFTQTKCFNNYLSSLLSRIKDL